MKVWASIIIVFISIPLAAFAQRPDAPPYAIRGMFPVGARDFTIEDDTRPLKLTVWYPALNPDEQAEAITYVERLARVEGRALQDALPDVDSGPYPLVIFSHGLGGLRFQSIFFTEHLASHGFVVIAPDHPGSTVFDVMLGEGSEETIIENFAVRPYDISRAIDFAETLSGPGGVLEGVIETDKIAVSGHSFGGYTALSVGGARLDTSETVCEGNLELCQLMQRAEDIASARGLERVPEGLWPPTTDSRVDALVLLAPAGGHLFQEAGLAEVTLPTLIIVGSLDSATVPEEDAYPMYEYIGSMDKTLITLEYADHYIFVDECSELEISFGLFDSCSDDVWDMTRAHDLTNHFTTAFLLSVLKEDQEAAKNLLPGAVDFRGVIYATTR